MGMEPIYKEPNLVKPVLNLIIGDNSKFGIKYHSTITLPYWERPSFFRRKMIELLLGFKFIDA